MKYLIIISLLTIIACSPVRNRYMTRSNDYDESKSNSSQIAQSKNQVAETAIVTNPKDTVLINLPPLYIDEGSKNKIRSMNAQLDSAIALFNNGKRIEACEKFNLLKETIKERDSLYYEAVFYSAECLIANNEYKLAHRLLNEIMAEKLSSSLKQRILLRQGHLLCALGDESTAQWYFDKLNSDYPNSIYLQLANCESLK